MSIASGLTTNGGGQEQPPAAYAPVTPPPLAANQSPLSGGNPAQGMGKNAGGGPPQYAQPAALSGTPAPASNPMPVQAPNGGFPPTPATPMALAPPRAAMSVPAGAPAANPIHPQVMANALRGQRGPIRG